MVVPSRVIIYNYSISISAPKVFTFVFNMVKPFLHPVTLDKISVFGSDKSEWSAALLKEIDADQLPVHFGGTMTDSNGDPKCSSLVSWCEIIVESL